MNRCEILRRVLASIERFTSEPYQLLISDNASSDGTSAMLTAYAADHPGQVTIWSLPENMGISRARNAHWARCVGQDAVRLDDKVEILTPHWSQQLRRQAAQHHALMAMVDPDTRHLWAYADRYDALEYPLWKCGAAMFIPAEVSAALGAFDELTWPETGEPVTYGWEDLLWMDRATSIGWAFKYSLCADAAFLARASATRRAETMAFEPEYKRISAEYQNGERDILIPIETTEGYAAGEAYGRQARHSKVGAAMELAYP